VSVEWDPKWTRSERLRHGPQSGPGWHVEWATSAFDVDANGKPRRFQYIALDVILAPWEGLDDVLVEKGYRTRDSLQPTVRGDANEEPHPREAAS
jgi:hypothetical protein